VVHGGRIFLTSYYFPDNSFQVFDSVDYYYSRVPDEDPSYDEFGYYSD